MPTKDTSLLKQTCPACGTVVDTAAADPLARVACQNCGEKVRAERSFDQFVLLETVGIGGMGTVYKARDTLLDREVALKLLRKDLGEDIDYAARLQQEARVAASVNHPNVIQVYSSGTDHDQFYLVMELVDHGSLDDFIEQQKRLPEELVLETGMQVAKGLRAAYAKGLIHRDVKPANILFADDHTAKIGDFGLAGAAAEGAETRGEIWGTPYYVAPERLDNMPEDFRSDIYSLGGTLFHAISGRAPIEGESTSAVTLRQLKNQPVNLATVAPDVSEPTVRVLNRMIAPDPGKRFSSYDELVTELEQAYGLLTGKKEFLITRRKKLPWIIGVIVLLLAVIGIGSWAFVSRKRAQTEINAASARAEQLVTFAPLQGRLMEAQRGLSQINYSKDAAQSKEAFARIALDSQKKQPIYDWARLQQGLAALILHDSSQARQAFQDIVNAGETGFSDEDKPQAEFLLNMARMMSAPGKAPADLKLNSDNYQAFGFLVAALKNIDQANAADALPLLEQFLKAKPTGKDAWVGEYRGLAQKYVDDCKLYLDWKKEGDEAKDAVSLSRHHANTTDILKRRRFRMFGALSDDVRAAEKGLQRQTVDQQKSESAERAAQKKKQAEAATAEVARKKPQWLTDWKNRLVNDLNRAHYNAAVADTNGVQYTGIGGATADKLLMKVPYGELALPWALIGPQTLLKISTSFIDPKSPDAADRNWVCAVYANETGQADEAKRLAGEAAKLKPEYAQMWTTLQSQPKAAR